MDNKKNKENFTLSGLIGLWSIIIGLFTVITIDTFDIRQLELLTHFKLQYLIASIIFSGIYLWAKQYRASVIMALCAVINGLYIMPWYFSAEVNSIEQKKVDVKDMKLFHLNLLSSNKQYSKLLELINKEDPDIIIVQEVSYAWDIQLEKLTASYPYYESIPRHDNFGIAIFSKIKLTDIQQVDWGNAGLPGFRVCFEMDNVTVQLATLHPLPPVNQIYYEQRNKSLTSVMSEIKGLTIPSLLIGDLNMSMWSPDYSILQQDNKLLNARKGFGVISTWPAVLGPLGIPIDHVLVSKQFIVDDFYAGPNVGSDHLPVIAILRLREDLKGHNGI